MNEAKFDAVADAYEAMIDWPRRLANEQGLFRRVFEQCNARSVLDAACGTGHHAAMFGDWGLSAQGADASAEMIDRCRRRWGQTSQRQWVVRPFEEPTGRVFDVVICTGNSLALAPDRAAIDGVIATLLQSVRRPGGALVLGVLNLWALADGRTKWQKCIRADLPGMGDSLIIKGVQRIGDRGQVNLLISRLLSPPMLDAHEARFVGIEADALHAACARAGAARVELLGDYQNHSYDRSTSADLIAIAWT